MLSYTFEDGNEFYKSQAVQIDLDKKIFDYEKEITPSKCDSYEFQFENTFNKILDLKNEEGVTVHQFVVQQKFIYQSLNNEKLASFTVSAPGFADVSAKLEKTNKI